MKNFKRRLSIILTLVLVITSLGFTGAFAVDGEVEGPDAQVEQAAPTGDGDVVEDVTPAEEGTPADVVDPAVESGEPTDVVTDGGDPQTPEVPEADANSADGPFKITWLMDDGVTVLDEKEYQKGELPVYDGVPEKAEDENYVYTFKEWSPAVVEATADATYTAVFTKKSKAGTPAKPEVDHFSSFKSIALEWKAVTKDADGVAYTDETKAKVRYLVRYKKGSSGTWKSWTDVGTKLKYHTPKPYTLDPLSKYYFQVRAYIPAEDGSKILSAATSCYDSPVAPIRYKLYIKQGGTLTSHYKYNANTDKYSSSGAGRMKVKAGQVIYADRFATGKYMFTNGKYVFYVSRTRVGKKSCVYTTKWNYSLKEMQYFANDKGLRSKTPYLIITSAYTQHVYVLKGTKSGTRYRNWKTFTLPKTRSSNKYAYEKTLKKGVRMDWECGTGTASDPTPTSHTGLKETTRWVKVRHSIPWWTKFHGTASFHGNKIRTNNKGLGKPVSSGCVRNPHERAHWIYDVCKKGTQVYIY